MRKLGLHLSVEYKILAYSDVITASYQRMFLYFKLFKAVVHTIQYLGIVVLNVDRVRHFLYMMVFLACLLLF